jgi:hypothetical protein
LLVARKIKAVAVQPVHDAQGTLTANVGDQISEADYDKLTGADQAVYRLVIVEDQPKQAKAAVTDQGEASDSFQVAKTSKGGKP